MDCHIGNCMSVSIYAKQDYLYHARTHYPDRYGFLISLLCVAQDERGALPVGQVVADP